MNLPKPLEPTTVLILGAGMSGLVAGYELMNAGYDVRVLEARDVAGGRIQTIRNGFTDGLYAEAGAMFVHGNHDTTIDYADLLGVQREDFQNDGSLPNLYYLKGKSFRFPHPPGGPVHTDWPYPLTEAERQLGLTGIGNLYGRVPAKLPRGPLTGSWPVEADAPNDELTYADFMRKNGASEGAVELLSVGFNALMGDGPGTYSALMMLYGDMFTNNHTVRLQVVDGNDKFPAAFASKLGDRISYNSPVTSIGQDSDKVWVTVDNGGTQHQVTGDYLICTLPFTVLRDIPVSPAFTEEKQCAIRTLKYTSAVRICLQFSDAFWLKEGLYGLAVTDLPMMIAYPQPNQAPPGGILNVLSTGASARQLASLEESARLETVLCQISEFFPQARALYVGGVTKDWDSDPYARGGYAYFEKGQVIPLTRAIELSERRICFAGDHASLLSGWMEGALNSGLRAAATVGSSASGASQAGYLTPVNIHSIV